MTSGSRKTGPLTGFELPAPVRASQLEFDRGLAVLLERTAVRLEAKVPRVEDDINDVFQRLEMAVVACCPGGPKQPAAAGLRSFLAALSQSRGADHVSEKRSPTDWQLTFDGISIAFAIQYLGWFGVGPSVAGDDPKGSQGFEQVRITFSQSSRVRLMNGEPLSHGPVFEGCPVLNRVAIAGVVEESCAFELECNPASLLCQ
jgi:hypothetical protein